MPSRSAPEPSRQLAANLRRLCHERGIVTADLATTAGLARADLGRVMRAELSVRLDTMVRLAGALDVPPEELLAGIRWIPDGRGGGRYELD